MRYRGKKITYMYAFKFLLVFWQPQYKNHFQECCIYNAAQHSYVEHWVSVIHGQRKQKKRKISDKYKHLYHPPLNSDDDVSYGRNLELLSVAMTKNQASYRCFETLLACKFTKRWSSLVEVNMSLCHRT